MLELIDQSDPQRLTYRCTICEVQGVSSPVEAQEPERRFLDWSQKPNKWVRHVCNPADIVRASERRAAAAEAARIEGERVAAERAAKEEARALTIAEKIAALQAELLAESKAAPSKKGKAPAS